MVSPRHDRPASAIGPGSRRQNSVLALSLSLTARGLRAAGRLLAFALAARLFRLGEVGDFAFWLAAGSLTAVLSDLGLSEHLTRALPGAVGNNGIVRAALRARLAALLPCLVFGWLIGVAFGGIGDLGAVGSFAFGVAVGFSDFLSAIRRATGRFDLEILESGLVTGVGLGTGLAAVASGLGFVPFQLALGAGAVGAAAVRVVALARTVRSSGDGAGPGAGRVAAEARWLWARAILGWGYLDATVLLVGLVSDPVQVALFAGAARLVGIMTQPLLAVAAVFTPVLAHEASFGRERFEAASRRLNWIGLASVPCAFAACIVLGHFGIAGFGAGFRSAQPILALLALGFAVHAGVLSSVPLIVLGRERSLVLSTIGGQSVLWITTLALAGRRGAEGGAIGVLTCLIAVKVATVVLYQRARLPLGGWLQCAAIAAVLAWFLAVWNLDGWPRWSLLGGGAVMSGLATLVLLTRTKVVTHAA